MPLTSLGVHCILRKKLDTMEKISINKVKSNICDYICKIWVILNWAAAWYLEHHEIIRIVKEILDFILWLQGI